MNEKNGLVLREHERQNTRLAQVDYNVDIIELVGIGGSTGEFVAFFELGDFERLFEEWVRHGKRIEWSDEKRGNDMAGAVRQS